MKTTICNICGEQAAREETETREVEHEVGRLVVHGLRHMLCSECGSDSCTAEQSRHNQRLVMVAVKVNQRLLTGSDIFSFRSRHNFTQLQAAEIFGGGPNAFSKYENEQVAQNRSMDLLIRVADAVPEAMEWLKVRAGIDADSPAFQPFEIFEVATAERTFRSVVDWIVEEESFLFVEPFDQTRATAVASNEDEYVNAA